MSAAAAPLPAAALHGGERALPVLPPCVLYAGTERRIRKAIALQAERGPLFDVACDCEDGAPVGEERAHAAMIAREMAGAGNRHGRVGARLHDVRHPAWAVELDVLLREAGDRVAFLTLPKVESAADVRRLQDAIASLSASIGLTRTIPLSVLIETPAAVRDAWSIAAEPAVMSLDFGTLDFVSAHHGAIPQSAMESPGQFEHAIVRRAKIETSAAALAHAVVPAHGITRAIDDADAIYADARRARDEFGFLRMWAIHPSQVEPIVAAMRPDHLAVQEATIVLNAARDAHWAPLRIGDRLEDRASYRYYWGVLQRARAAGAVLPPESLALFEPDDAAAPSSVPDRRLTA